MQVGILGNGLSNAFEVAFNGTLATFSVLSDTYVLDTVPAGATAGPAQIRTGAGTLRSYMNFQVLP